MKKIAPIILSMVLVFGLSACVQKDNSSKSQATGRKEAKIEKRVSPFADLCDYFPRELVETAIGKSIVRIEKNDLVDPTCYYFTQYIENYENSYSGPKKPGGPKVVVVYDTKDFAKDRITNEKHGSKYTNDPTIGMDNFVVRNNVNKIWSVALSLGGEKYIRIKFVDDAVTGDDLVKIAREFAKKLKGDSSLDLSSNSAENSTTQNIDDSQQAVATGFFDNLAALKIQDALAMMDTDENTKQAWGVNFNTIELLKVNNIEEAFKEEWTESRQSFKVQLYVKVKPEGEQMGWQNGQNFRWITLEKNANGQWLVHELASNP